MLFKHSACISCCRVSESFRSVACIMVVHNPVYFDRSHNFCILSFHRNAHRCCTPASLGEYNEDLCGYCASGLRKAYTLNSRDKPVCLWVTYGQDKEPHVPLRSLMFLWGASCSSEEPRVPLRSLVFLGGAPYSLEEPRVQKKLITFVFFVVNAVLDGRLL